MCAVHEGVLAAVMVVVVVTVVAACGVLVDLHHLAISPVKGFATLRVGRTDWLGQISEVHRVAEIEFLALIVRDHPGEHRVLREVVERSPRSHVAVH